MAEELEKLGFCPAKDKCIKRSPSPKLSLYLGSPGFYVVDRSGGITVMPFQILDSEPGHFLALYSLKAEEARRFRENPEAPRIGSMRLSHGGIRGAEGFISNVA